MKAAIDTKIEQIRSYLDEVTDPEVPVLSINDLGIVRDIILKEDSVEVLITPTYTGCPAMDMIRAQIKMNLLSHGFPKVEVVQVLSPPWTTEWMSESGKQKLKDYGIAPPNPKQQVCSETLFAPHEAVQCPHCDSWHTRRISEFGATACKAMYQCEDCHEPFEYFKCH
jgi:ring-1,2-phenylacetyl-CoA epoxidase subunit PaaD